MDESRGSGSCGSDPGRVAKRLRQREAAERLGIAVRQVKRLARRDGARLIVRPGCNTCRWPRVAPR